MQVVVESVVSGSQTEDDHLFLSGELGVAASWLWDSEQGFYLSLHLCICDTDAFIHPAPLPTTSNGNLTLRQRG